MHRDILVSCLPYLTAIVVSLVCLCVLVRISGARLDLGVLRRLSRDELGGVQSLSFVLTLPVFIMIMMFIVQLSQLTIAKIVVEYAAFASARSAMVWIPANLGGGFEQENQIWECVFDERFEGSDGRTWDRYHIEPGGPKLNKIHFAAAMALMPICPSRNVGAEAAHPGNGAVDALSAAYRAISPEADRNPRITRRIRHKLAYALENTWITLEIAHKDTEPPLQWHDVGPYAEEFTLNEIGWQDQITVTVLHHFALLPGPGRLLARRVDPPSSGLSGRPYQRDRVAEHIHENNGVHYYPISATVRLSNEGEKPVLPYIQASYQSREPPELSDGDDEGN